MGIRRSWMMVLGVGLLTASFIAPAGLAAPAPRKAAKRGAKAATPQGVSVSELAARFQMRVIDEGTFVTLRGALVTVRLMPGTNRVSIVGDSHRLKAAIRRSGAKVIIPTRPAQFISTQILAKRRQMIGKRQAFKVPEVRVPKLPPAQPVLPPVNRAPRERPAVQPKPAPVRPIARVKAPDREWNPRSADRHWKWIVIHHSDTPDGNAAVFDKVHRTENGWDSLGYHFVIGNGTDSGDGAIEVGPRWPIQKHGAHARNHELGDNRYNEQGIGICLVGDFDIDGQRPSRRQMDELVRLTEWLMARYNIPAHMVVRHCDCCKTACPGKHFPWAAYQRRIR